MIREFHTPRTVDAAVALRTELAGKACYLAGGTELGSTAFRTESPQEVISLAQVLSTAISADDGGLLLGAGCTLQTISVSENVPKVLRDAAKLVANRNIRNMATLGGNIASNKTFASMLPALVVFDAQLELADAGGGRSTVGIMTYLGRGGRELILAVRIPKKPGRRASTAKLSKSANDIATLVVAASYVPDNDRVREPRLAVEGVADHVVQLDSIEAWLEGSPLPSRDAITDRVSDVVTPKTSIKGSAEFKTYLAGTMIADALHRAAADTRKVNA
ncbi:MAG: hypothetical protein CO108_09265 [Deltaproteobacteria bacterium CG_4_9_14_3_um_filter_63_12]|nr:MAG: hypothetical protein CO108_09265 [Deltaproteobacteria bacterium CG_4_9_14_3_um_filter_63_12]